LAWRYTTINNNKDIKNKCHPEEKSITKALIKDDEEYNN
jgi:hypothetical protein